MTTVAVDAVRARLDAAPMSRVQIGAVALTVVLSALDGYDVLSVTFAAPAITRDWGIDKAALGRVLASGLAGMALGSFVLAPVADRIGRRLVILLSLALMAVGMALSATATGVGALVAWRVVTGVGIGACIVVINPLAAEFTNARRRTLGVALMALGYPVGGTIGGLVAGVLLAFFDWHAIFLTGFVAALVLMAVVAFVLPESPAFLLTQRNAASLDRLNAVLRRFDQPPLDHLPPPVAGAGGYAAVFAAGQRAATARMAAVAVLFSVAVYYTLSWLPQMVADAGFAPSTASLVGAVANISGVVGGVLLGVLAARFGLRRLTVATMAGLGLAIGMFGLVPPALGLLIATAAIAGFFLFAGSAGFYATLAGVFTPAARASGIGFVVGSGRVGSALGPYAAGLLFAHGLDRTTVSVIFGALALVAAGLLAGLRPPATDA